MTRANFYSQPQRYSDARAARDARKLKLLPPRRKTIEIKRYHKFYCGTPKYLRIVHLCLSSCWLLGVAGEGTFCGCKESRLVINRDRQKMKKQTKSPSASKSPSKKAVAAKPAASKSPTKKAVAAAKAAVVKEDKRRREPPFLLYKEPSEPSFSEGIESVINLLKGKKRIAVLTGAGISVSCGIPDFRTKGSGLYSTLDTGVSFCCCGLI
jgi:hypothetical protein